MDILHNGTIALYHGDCLDLMHEIPDGSVDAIICDIPYGKTSCKWDVVIPFEPMWAALKRIIKPRGAIVLFGSQPFTSALVMSNPKMFRDELIWEKSKATGHAACKIKHLKAHENVLIFADGRVTYNPQKQPGKPYKSPYSKHGNKYAEQQDRAYNTGSVRYDNKDGLRYPRSILRFSDAYYKDGHYHPTQKPVALLEYLIRTYTNEGETVLDFTFGSCTAGVAALNTKRRFIGIERDDTYYALGVQRVQTAIDNLPPRDV